MKHSFWPRNQVFLPMVLPIHLNISWHIFPAWNRIHALVSMLASLLNELFWPFGVDLRPTLTIPEATVELLCKLTSIRWAYMYSSDWGIGPSCAKKYRVSELRNALDEYKNNSHDLEAYKKVRAFKLHFSSLSNMLHRSFMNLKPRGSLSRWRSVLSLLSVCQLLIFKANYSWLWVFTHGNRIGIVPAGPLERRTKICEIPSRFNTFEWYYDSLLL